MISASIVREYTKDLRVLYVEDDEELRAETAEVLKLLFDEVKIAKDGKEGFEFFSFDGEFDLVITDIFMPHMDGIELVTKIKEKRADQSIVVISAHDDSLHLISLINLGVKHFILKPISNDRLLSVLYDVSKAISDKNELESFHEYLKQKVDEEFEKRRASQALLIQQSKMASLGEMIGAITHQWKQPLGSLSVHLQDLKEYGVSKNDNEIIETCDIGLSQIDFMHQTVEDFKNFLKPDTKREDFDLFDATKEVVSLIRKQFANHNIELVLLEPDQKFVVFGNRSQLKQSVLNLFSNAYDSINILKEHSQNEVMGKIEIQIADNEGKIVLSVTDNGIGIGDEIIDKLFEPYFTTKPNKGTGIGLYIAKTIIETNFDGTITAKQLEDGARFEIALPR